MNADVRPTFKAIRECFAEEHGIVLERRRPFKNDDLMIGQFRRNGTWASADYRDDELIEPETVEHWCRIFSIDPNALHIQCGDGHVSVKPPVARPIDGSN